MAAATGEGSGGHDAGEKGGGDAATEVAGVEGESLAEREEAALLEELLPVLLVRSCAKGGSGLV